LLKTRHPASPVNEGWIAEMGTMRLLARFAAGIALTVGCLEVSPGMAQEPAIPALFGEATKDTPAKTDASIEAPTEDNPEATLAETVGPIRVDEAVDDETIRRKLLKLLPHFPGVRTIDVEVDEGVVTLTGHVEDTDVRDRLRDFVRRVEGVTLVLNQTRTDSQVLSAWQFAAKRLRAYGEMIQRKWLMGVVAIVLVVLAALLARLIGRFSEVILRPLSGNAMLRSVLGSVLSGLVVVLGFLGALNVLGLTEAVLSFLGLAGVVALAIGFAFRDIAENFIASVLLGVRRPFRVGDFIEIAGQAGIVRSLNTRATVLVTLDGAQVRIPNAKVFKEMQVNRSASTSVRVTFDVLIPYSASTTRAQEAIGRALNEHQSILKDPPPRALVEELGPDAVRLRVYFWTPARNVDGLQISSEAKLKAKVALQEAGIAPGAPPSQVVLQRPREESASRSVGATPAAAPGASGNGRENLQRDARVAAQSHATGPPQAAEHALSAAEDRVADEGHDLIERDGSKDESTRAAHPA
jgi:small-conductance mechanosensitive channel